MPVLAGAPATGVSEVVAGLGGNLLATTIERAWDRLRGEQRGTVGREALRAALGEALTEALSADGARRMALGQEMANLVRSIDAVDVALVEAGDDERLRSALQNGVSDLARSLAKLGRALLDELQVSRNRWTRSPPGNVPITSCKSADRDGTCAAAETSYCPDETRRTAQA
jgi:hypothetical protein